MFPTIPAQQPRRRVWLWVAGLGLGALVLGSAWKEILRNEAISELRAAGLHYTGRGSVWLIARDDWRLFFKRESWHVTPGLMGSGGASQNLAAVQPAFRRLNIQNLTLINCPTLQNVDGLKNLDTLKAIGFYRCTSLQNVNGLTGHTALRMLYLMDCPALENVDALRELTSLTDINLSGCTKLSAKSIAALKAALPNTTIIGLDGKTVSAP